jgi:hypothetical protein
MNHLPPKSPTLRVQPFSPTTIHHSEVVPTPLAAATFAAAGEKRSQVAKQ